MAFKRFEGRIPNEDLEKIAKDSISALQKSEEFKVDPTSVTGIVFHNAHIDDLMFLCKKAQGYLQETNLKKLVYPAATACEGAYSIDVGGLYERSCSKKEKSANNAVTVK